MKFQATTPDGTQGATRKAPSGGTRRHTKRHAKWRNADKARSTLSRRRKTRAPDAEQNSQCAQNKRRAAHAQNTECRAEFKTTRAMYQAPTHRSCKIGALQPRNADKIRPSRLAYRARRALPAIAQEIPKASFKFYLYAALSVSNTQKNTERAF